TLRCARAQQVVEVLACPVRGCHAHPASFGEPAPGGGISSSPSSAFVRRGSCEVSPARQRSLPR
ncbi:MAG: hypothetical protein M3Z66_25110, partial [Chloroflexota bacterium]|nr:hypothetical protein [Chloroflexota bacterium]